MNSRLVVAVLLVILAASAAALGPIGTDSDSPPTESLASQSTLDSAQSNEGNATRTVESASPAQTTTANKSVPVPSPSSSARPQSESNETTQPLGPRITGADSFNQSNASQSRTVVYNGTSQRVVNESSTQNSSAAPTSSLNDPGSLTPSSITGSLGARAQTANNGIIGTDDRVSVGDSYDGLQYPWTTVAQLQVTFQDGSQGTCSGVVIDVGDKASAHLLTAGHCVYDEDRGGWIDIFDQSATYVAPGAIKGQEPFGRVGIQNVTTYTGWTANENPAYDIALITLDERIGRETGSIPYVGIDTPSSDVYTYSPTRVTGYPGDKPRGTMWTAEGSGVGTYDYVPTSSDPEDVTHHYTLDTASGVSGGPVWVESYPMYDGPTLASIHAYAVDLDSDGQTDVTQGTRITERRSTQFRQWAQADTVVSPENDQYEPNDDFISATPIAASDQLNDLRIADGEFDVFAVELTDDDQLTTTSRFDHTEGDLDLILYSSSGQPITWSMTQTDDERITHTANQTETYYIAMYGRDSASASYSLTTIVESSAVEDLTAQREMNATTVSPGDTVSVTVSAETSASSADLNVRESFSARPATISVTDNGSADSVSTDGTDITAVWQETTSASISYEVTVPENSSSPTRYNVSGKIINTQTNTSRNITGDTTIEVITECRYPSYSGSDCTVGALGLLDAAADYRSGVIGPKELLDIAASYRSGGPIQTQTAVNEKN
jgi:glutamyl endopeptidase